MKKLILTILLFTVIALVHPAFAAADRDAEIDQMLTVTETLFQSMKAGKYATTWRCITEKSKQYIIDDVRSECAKVKVECPEPQVRSDFESAGSMARAYWDSFLRQFDPSLVLSHSTWGIGKVEKDNAEITIQYEKSKKPARLKLFKEKGKWKVGLEETFRSRRYLPSIVK